MLCSFIRCRSVLYVVDLVHIILLQVENTGVNWSLCMYLDACSEAFYIYVLCVHMHCVCHCLNVRVYMCECVYCHMYFCVYLNVCLCVCMCVCMWYVCTYVCMYVRLYVCMYVFKCVHIYIVVWVLMYVCLCVYCRFECVSMYTSVGVYFLYVCVHAHV